MGQLHAVNGVIDILLPILRLGLHKTLMDGQSHQSHAIHKRVPLELPQVIHLFTGHLHVQHIHPLHAQFCGVVDYLFDGIFVARKMPIGIGRQRELVALGAFGWGRSGRGGNRQERTGRRRSGTAGKKLASIKISHAPVKAAGGKKSSQGNGPYVMSQWIMGGPVGGVGPAAK